jgi:hypothetical protein
LDAGSIPAASTNVWFSPEIHALIDSQAHDTGPKPTHEAPFAVQSCAGFVRFPRGFAAMRNLIPSGLAHEIFLDVFERLASFEPGLTSIPQRIFDAYA